MCNGCPLNVPPKRNKDGAWTAAQVEKTRVAELWIHVERCIGRAKNYAILNNTIPLSVAAVHNDIVTVCCFPD